MRRNPAWFVVPLLLGGIISVGRAAQFPPACPDSIGIGNIQNPAAPCHPSDGDTVWVGIGGVVTARDTKPSGTGFYLQLSGGGPYSGINVFTANTIWPVAVGDSVIVRPGKVLEYGGETEMVSLTGSFGSNLSVYKVLGPVALPPFHVGNTTDFNTLPSNTALEPYECGLAKVLPRGGPLRVARVYGTSGFMVVDSACTTGICDSVYVDVVTLPNPSLGVPPLGTTLPWIRGIVGQTAAGYRIRIRDGNEFNLATPPNLVDAYPILDTRIRVTFDRDVTTASATNVANYSLGSQLSGSSVDVATMDGQAAVLLDITEVLPHAALETITASGIVSLDAGLPMTSPQSRSFINGVLSCAEVRAPDPDSLSGPCRDRSRYAGGGGSPGPRLSISAIAVATADSVAYVQDPGPVLRGGLGVVSPPGALQAGHRYLVTGNAREANGETVVQAASYVADQGASTAPDWLETTLATALDVSCDATQSVTNGKDLEGFRIVIPLPLEVARTAGLGTGFKVVDPDAPSDSLLIDATDVPEFGALAVGTYLEYVDGILRQAGSATVLRLLAAATYPAISPGKYMVSGRVINDRNGNGIYEPGNYPQKETGFSGRTVQSLGPSDQVLSTTLTHPLGFYHLMISTGQAYRVRVMAPDGWVFSAPPYDGLFAGNYVGNIHVWAGRAYLFNSPCRDTRRTYATSADFSTGTLDAVTLDGDHIKLPEDPTTNSAISEFAWIANLSEGTVSKVSTVTGMEVARYYTGPPIDGDYTHLFPWTTVVDEAGNCWVANWATGHVGSVTEILAEGGIDRDGSGTIKTSKDLTPPYGEISKSEMYEWGQDERVIRHYLVGSTNGAPDALVLDKTGKLWIGLFNENKIVQVDPNLPPADYAPGGTPTAPVPLATVPIIMPGTCLPSTPHGLALSPNGLLCGVTGGNYAYVVDPGVASGGIEPSPKLTKYIDHNGSNYGIAVDKHCVAWISLFWLGPT